MEKKYILEILEAEKEMLLLKMATINELLKYYKDENIDDITLNQIKELIKIQTTAKKYNTPVFKIDDAFPKNETIDNQIIFLLEKDSIVKKRSMIEKELLEFSGKNKNIREQLRRMLKERKLFQIKYNNSNKLSYYGLISWLTESEKGKPELLETYEPNLSLENYNNPEIIIIKNT